MNRLHFTFLILFPCIISAVYGQKAEVLINGFRSDKGQVIVSVFKDNQSFQDEKPFVSQTLKKSDIKNGMLRTSFTLSPGTYGICLLDDENSDQKMKYNMVGIPQEGYGFSNFILKGFYRPKLNDFDFTVSENQTTKVIIVVQYF